MPELMLIVRTSAKMSSASEVGGLQISPEEFKALGEDWTPPPPGKSDEPVVPQDIEKVGQACSCYM